MGQPRNTLRLPVLPTWLALCASQWFCSLARGKSRAVIGRRIHPMSHYDWLSEVHLLPTPMGWKACCANPPRTKPGVARGGQGWLGASARTVANAWTAALATGSAGRTTTHPAIGNAASRIGPAQAWPGLSTDRQWSSRSRSATRCHYYQWAKSGGSRASRALGQARSQPPLLWLSGASRGWCSDRMVEFRSSPWLLLPLLLVSRAGESSCYSVDPTQECGPCACGRCRGDWRLLYLLLMPQLLPRTPYLPLQPRGSLAARAARSWPSCGSARRRRLLTARAASTASQPAPSARPWVEGWSRPRTPALSALCSPLDPHQHQDRDREGFGRSVGALARRSASGWACVRQPR